MFLIQSKAVYLIQNCLFFFLFLSGYRNYKKLLKDGCSLATIPYLGLFLREITHICDGNPKEVTKSEDLKHTSSGSTKRENAKKVGANEKDEETEEDEDEMDEEDTDGTQDEVKDSPHLAAPATQALNSSTLHNWERVLLLGARISEVIKRVDDVLAECFEEEELCFG